MTRATMIAFRVLVAAALVLIFATVGDVLAVVAACLGMLWLAVEQAQHDRKMEAAES